MREINEKTRPIVLGEKTICLKLLRVQVDDVLSLFIKIRSISPVVLPFPGQLLNRSDIKRRYEDLYDSRNCGNLQLHTSTLQIGGQKKILKITGKDVWRKRREHMLQGARLPFSFQHIPTPTQSDKRPPNDGLHSDSGKNRASEVPGAPME